jgi:antitoxin VapB
MAEFREKQKRIRPLLERHKLDALLLSRMSSFAWETRGAASYVNMADSMCEIFRRGIDVYAETGYTDQWQYHHQGGPAGYEPREIMDTSCSEEVVSTNQIYAWNPSITGTKSEDTILVTEQGYEILTVINDWPRIPSHINEQTICRPASFERT